MQQISNNLTSDKNAEAVSSLETASAFLTFRLKHVFCDLFRIDSACIDVVGCLYI